MGWVGGWREAVKSCGAPTESMNSRVGGQRCARASQGGKKCLATGRQRRWAGWPSGLPWDAGQWEQQ